MALVHFNNRPLVNSFDSLFNEFINNFPAQWSKGTAGDNSFAPKANIHETKDAYHLELIVPGRSKEDFKVSVEDSMLNIEAEKKEATTQDDYKTIRREFSVQGFKRSFYVDDSVQLDTIQARYENGVLKLLLPKKENAAPTSKQIAIQ